jgi:hypothetical protein
MIEPFKFSIYIPAVRGMLSRLVDVPVNVPAICLVVITLVLALPNNVLTGVVVVPPVMVPPE